MRQLAEQGQWTSGWAPNGYRFDPTRRPVPLAIDPKKARWLHQACAGYLDAGSAPPPSPPG
ncbi:MAG: hypothetical protein OWV35_08230 [Firmicutes bacterium]|nr:hypothetical protein [Bacillota bacterium]